jgi:oligopeptide/dipeptide ABC transporter ATP-binding protein
MDDLLLEVRHLKTYFETNKGTVKAVDDVSFALRKGEILGIVGESGCGKSTTIQSLLRLIGYRKQEHVQGEVIFEGQDLIKKTDKQMQNVRGHKIGFIAQNPMTSLNPVYTIGNQIAEVPVIHERAPKKKAWSIALDMLKKVGIPDHEERAKQFAHQFSGGMKQRAVVAMALAGNPSLVIADEPTTALDVTIQAQILDLLVTLRDETQAGILLITHDLGVVAEICDRVAVMYAGKIVELATVDQLFHDPQHPYTKGLIASIPKIGSRKRIVPIKGHPPNLYEPAQGCLFRERCPFAFDSCEQAHPGLRLSGDGHQVACYLVDDKGESRA